MSDLKLKPIKISIFVPLKACGCAYSHFLDQMMSILLPYRSKVKFEVKDSDSKEAEELHIHQMSVVIENDPDSEKPIIITNKLYLEKYLTRL